MSELKKTFKIPHGYIRFTFKTNYQARDMELETALSKNPTSEDSQATLNLLQEVRQKDNALKKLQKKHDETMMQVKKEVEKQVRPMTYAI